MPLHDFGYGRVLGHQHDNGGGWVADTAHVAPSVFVGPRAHVSHHARVSGNVRLEDEAIVADRARVSGNVIIRSYGGAGGTVRLGGNLVICQYLYISGGDYFGEGTYGDRDRSKLPRRAVKPKKSWLKKLAKQVDGLYYLRGEVS